MRSENVGLQWACLAMVGVVVACAELPLIVKDAVQDVDCVEGAIQMGVLVYEDIAAVCVPLAVSQVETIAQAAATPSPAALEAGVVSPAKVKLAAKAKQCHHRVSTTGDGGEGGSVEAGE